MSTLRANISYRRTKGANSENHDTKPSEHCVKTSSSLLPVRNTKDNTPSTRSLAETTNTLRAGDHRGAPTRTFQRGELSNSHVSNAVFENSNKGRFKKKTTGPVHNARYKAKLCKNWESAGTCPYFEKCQFAHGAEELEKWAMKRAKSKVLCDIGRSTDGLSPNKDLDNTNLERLGGDSPKCHVMNPVLSKLHQSTLMSKNEQQQAMPVSKNDLQDPLPVMSYQKERDNHNNCIGQLFSMATVFPSSIT